MYEDAIRHFWWNNIYKDMQNYVSSCKLCLKTNTGHSPKIPLNPFEIPSAPFQTIHVDLLKFHTPSKEFKNSWSNLYINYWELNQLKLQCINLQRTVSARELIARSLVFCANLCVIILKTGQRIYVM